MNNVSYEVKGDELIIRCKVNAATLKAATPSASGKTLVVASSEGVERVSALNGKGIMFSLNVMQKRQQS